MNLQSLDLNLLLVFEALMEERSVTRAAARVGLSQPAMSNSLARLRSAFNDQLLVRTASGMSPTSTALKLIIPVRTALAQLRTAIEDKPAFEPELSKNIFRLLANDYAEMLLLAPVITKLRVQSPEIGLRIHRPPALFKPPDSSALADSYDLAVGFYPDALALDPHIRFEILWEDNNVCIASGSHSSINGRLTVEDYVDARHVAVFYKLEGPGIIDTLLAQQGYSRRSVVFVPNFATVPFVVAESDLIATVPEKVALRFKDMLNIQVLPAPVIIPTLRLTMLWHERAHSDPAHEWLRGMIRKTAESINK
jgi:DNA-binding transcriptional LysR family regulator